MTCNRLKVHDQLVVVLIRNVVALGDWDSAMFVNTGIQSWQHFPIKTISVSLRHSVAVNFVACE